MASLRLNLRLCCLGMHQELTGLPPSNTPAIEVVREPGSTWVYSPAGYTVIQAILMTIYGKPFSEIMADVVLKPLHLGGSTFNQPTPAIGCPFGSNLTALFGE